jgi:hypothetical protein
MSMIVLGGVLALVIDMGRMYITRANLQYQCDAAALAGAMELPLPASGDARTTAIYNAKQQAQRCASAMGLNLNDSDISFPADDRIRVIHNRSNKFMVAGVLGFYAPKVIGAAAAVNVGGARVLGRGAFPVGVSDETIANVAPGTTIRIWDEDKITDDAGNIVSGGSRGWLNFNFVYSPTDPDSRTVSQSQSNSDLNGWVDFGYDKSLYAGTLGQLDGDTVNGSSGTRDSTIHKALNRIGDVVFLPVYDNVYDRSYMEANISPTPSIGWSNDNYYHVIGFAAFLITDVKHGGSNKYIAGQFVKKQIGGSYGAPTTGGSLGGSAIVE